MTRVVLVEHSASELKLYRQPQWMAEVRRNPAAASLPKRYFDLEEERYGEVLQNWTKAGADQSLEAAVEFLERHGAAEIVRS